MAGWTPVVETSAAPTGWTPVEENAPVSPPKPNTYQKLTAGYNPDVEEWAQKHPVVGPIVRFLDATGGAAMSAPEAIVKGITGAVKSATTGQKYPLAQTLLEAGQGWADPKVRQGALSVLPEALGVGAGNVAAGEAVPAAISAGASAVKSALPSAARAGAAFQDIKTTVGSVPIDTGKFSDSALELYTQSQRGATLPKAVRDLVNRATKPEGTPLTYSEAKDFQSNISSLSANQRMSLNPKTMRLVGQLNQDLKSALEDAADTAGKGEQFQKAMKEYHNAMQIQDWTDTVKSNAWKAALVGVGGYELKRLLGL